MSIKLTPEQKKYRKELFKLVKKKRTTPNEIKNLLNISGIPITIRNQIGENMFLNSIKSTDNFELLKWLHINGCNEDFDKYTKQDTLNEALSNLVHMCPKKKIKDIFYWLLDIGAEMKCYNYKEELAEEVNKYTFLFDIDDINKSKIISDYLIEKGYINYKDENNNNILQICMQKKQYINKSYSYNLQKILKYIDINWQNNDGNTLFHTIFNNYGMFRDTNFYNISYFLKDILKYVDIDIKIKNKKDETVLDLFIKNSKEYINKMKKCNWFKGIEYRYQSIINKIIEILGGDINDEKFDFLRKHYLEPTKWELSLS